MLFDFEAEVAIADFTWARKGSCVIDGQREECVEIEKNTSMTDGRTRVNNTQ